MIRDPGFGLRGFDLSPFEKDGNENKAINAEDNAEGNGISAMVGDACGKSSVFSDG